MQVALNTIANVVNDAGGLFSQIADFIDLRDEEANGGHAISEHVGKSEDYLIRRALNSRVRIGGIAFWEDSVGSFPSLDAANKLVNSTISQNIAIVEKVARGQSPGRAPLVAWFDAPTGYESYMPSFSGNPEIRPTRGVRVIVRRDATSPKGYSIVTAFPINPR